MPVNSCLPPLIAFSLVSIQVIDACSILTFVFDNCIPSIDIVPVYAVKSASHCNSPPDRQVVQHNFKVSLSFQAQVTCQVGVYDLPGMIAAPHRAQH